MKYFIPCQFGVKSSHIRIQCLELEITISVVQAQRLNCSDPDTVYSAGEGLVRAIRSHNNNNNNSNIRSEPGHAAITGAISFSPEDGQRDNIQLYLMARSAYY